MNTPVPGPKTSIPAQPSRDAVPRRLIVTAGAVIFAIRDWSLWVLFQGTNCQRQTSSRYRGWSNCLRSFVPSQFHCLHKAK